MDVKTDDSAGKCPFTGGSRGHSNRDWWPEHLDIGVLHTNAPAADFTVLTATTVSLALTNWTVLGEVQQVAPGQYQFTDPQAATNPARFYRVRSP